MNNKFLALATIFTLGAGGYATSASAATHSVQPGESLWSISQQYSISVDEIKAMNNLDSSLIFPSQQLKMEEEGKKYTIQLNDTLFQIAVAHNVTVDQLMAWNGLTSDLIYAGDTLAVTASTAVEVKKVAAETKLTAVQTTSQSQASIQTPDEVVQTFTMEATAYTASCAGCSGVTTNGTDLLANPSLKVISVDPSVIPLGTKVWVEGYGEAIAADTGGAIKGNKIDIFMPEKSDAINWGRKTVTVKVLK